MAEQVSHNVVNNPESTSDSSPLVDVAANHTTTTAAGTGNPTSTTDALDSSKTQNTSAVDANGATLTEGKAIDAGKAAAEPSAGDVVAQPADGASTAPPVETNEEKNNGKLGPQLANGVAGRASPGELAVEDSAAQDTSADPSVTSDTDIGRAETLTQDKDGKRHVRTTSVKKPTTFSKVSVSKNFLAKTATTAPAASKIGDKGKTISDKAAGAMLTSTVAPASSAAAPVAKPRLVAKSGSGLSQLQKARSSAESPSGPDASTVWNKNRPAPAQPAKSFTDEELKQQYGIHMATRLQSDENGKDPKWADIDDEDEDWVPEAVTWIDGTKSSLAPADSTPVPGPAQPEPPKPAEPQKPNLSALKKPVSTGPPKTILKPGAAAQAKQNGSAAASPGTEKPSLKAKSPAPAPVKSPWAALPPVDKVSPINPPVQAPPQHVPFATQDARAYDSPMPPPPAREIAADTFDRAWREGEGERRELFNSNSGRYEPAPERRSSIRQDPYGRKPALLTRPSQASGGPAEPSPAFQTRSGSNTDGPPSWGRRRGSSVSHGSVPADRRMSAQKAPDGLPAEERRQSTVVGHDMRAPGAIRPEPNQPMFAQQSAWDQQMPPQPAPGLAAPQEDMEDPVAKQQRLMKEKRELAMKRKQEEAAAEEAARKERLAAKLANLSGAGKSRQEREAEQAAAAAAAAEAAKSGNSAKQAVTAPSKDAEVAAASGPALESQVAPPPRSAAQDAPKAKLPSPEKLDVPTPKPQDSGLPSRTVSDQAQKMDARSQLSPNAHTPFSQAGPSPYRAPQSSYSSPGERKQQPFARDPFASPWPSAGTSNVWGASGIGNGTFEGASSFAPIQSSALPPPPGMGRPGTTNRISPPGLGQDNRSPSVQASQPQEQQRPFMSPSLDSREDGFLPPPRPNGVSPGPGRQQHAPGPIAPPSRTQQQQNQPQPEKISAWRNAAQALPQEYANAGKAPAKEVPQQRDDTFKETFRQTSGAHGKLGGPRKFEKAAYTVHDAQGSRSVESHAPAAPNTQTQPAAPPPTASPMNANKQAGVNTVRLPDVSGNPAQGGMPARQPPIGPPHTRRSQAPPASAAKVNFPTAPLHPIVDTKEQSPPPPETSTHPVYTGDAKRPNVRLPQAKPKVRLPPIGTPQQQPVSMPQRQPAWGPTGIGRPLVQSAQWQERFNGLFGNHRTQISTETPPSPPRTPPKTQDPILAVMSSTRMAMDDAPGVSGATVSLPHNQTKKLKSVEGFTIDQSGDATSKPSIEPMFSEELTFASKPTIRVPHHRYSGINFNPKHNMLATHANSRFTKPVDSMSYPGFDMMSLHPLNTKGVFVKLLGVKTRYNPIFWKKAQQSKPQGKFNKVKGTAGSGTAVKESGANSPVSATSNITPAAGPRKTSYQKASTPVTTPAQAPNQNSPAAAPANAPRSPAPTGGKRGGFKGHRGGRGGASVKAA